MDDKLNWHGIPLDKIQGWCGYLEDKINEEIKEVFKDAPKKGFCSITKLTNNPNKWMVQGETRSGYCPGLKVGYTCIVGDFWTSVVKDIDWDNKIFTTLNSKYKFDFYDDINEIFRGGTSTSTIREENSD